MKAYMKIMAVMAVFALAFIPMLATVEETDAAISIRGDGDPKITSNFDNSTAGTVVIGYTNSGSEATTLIVTAYYRGSDVPLATSEPVQIPGAVDNVPGEADVSISFKIDTAGPYDVVFQTAATVGGNDVKVDFGESSIIINVGTSIWSNWTTYAVIVIVILVIAIALVLKMRSAPKVESDTTFTEMEAEKRMKNTSESSAPTEKKAYVSKRKKE